LGLFWITFVVDCSLFVGISLYCCCTYVYITHFDIGFVLHKRLKATEVTENTEEWYIGEMYDRRQVYLWQAGQDRWVGNAKIKVQSAKLWNPGLVGMGVLVVALFSISRILYLLDVYYTPCRVGCQVKFLPQRGTEDTERRLERLAKFTAEIAETAEEPWGVEITGCLAGEGGYTG
jgi:hypothetical protein